MEKVTSQDGTSIAYYRSGTGMPLVLVPGTGGSNPAVGWTAVVPALEKHFSIYSVDRRSRGESGDGSTYAIEREIEDIAAVVDSIGEPVNLLGHSFGGICALEAGLLTRNIRKLVLYEPSISVPGVPVDYAEGLTDRLQALLDVGDREGVLTTFYNQVTGMSPHEIEQLSSSPAWSARLAITHTLLREMQAEERYNFDAQRFRDLHTPTLLLLGGDSSKYFKEAIEVLRAALPNSRIAIMPGQQHIAMYTAPDLFVSELVQFLLEPL
jgi:pimeloyl-ACP methyl ester carboxylesterase